MTGHGEAPVINGNTVHSYENVHAQNRDPANTGCVDNAAVGDAEWYNTLGRDFLHFLTKLNLFYETSNQHDLGIGSSERKTYRMTV